MRLKIIKENFKHHKFLSLLIILICSIITCFSIVAIEYDDFLFHAARELNSYENSHYQIKIESGFSLSLNGIYGKNDKLKDYYSDVSSFYSTSLIIEHDDKFLISGVLEGEQEDYYNAFNLDIVPKENEVVITRQIANSLGVSINDSLYVHLNDKKFEYKIIDVIKAKGIYKENHILIGGEVLNNYYGIENVKMPNLILIKLKDKNNADYIKNSIIGSYKGAQVTNIADSESAARMFPDFLRTILIMCVMLFVIILISLISIYRNKMNYQRNVFRLLGNIRYYNQINLISWGLLMAISLIIGGILSNCLFLFFYDLFYCTKPLIISFYSYLLSSFVILICPLILNLLKIKKCNIQKYKYIILISIIIMLVILSCIFYNTEYFSVIIVFLSILCTIGLCLFTFFMMKYLKNNLNRYYLYNLTKRHVVSKLIVLIQVFILFIFCFLISSLKAYNHHEKDFDDYININQVLVSTSNIENNEYDQIGISSSTYTDTQHIRAVFGFDSKQLKKYTTIDLTNEEQEKFDSGKYVILSINYYFLQNRDVGDPFNININGKDEEFTILKFLDNSFGKIVFVSNSDCLYTGYVLNEDFNINSINNQFKFSKYFLLDIGSIFNNTKDLYHKILSIARYVIMLLIIIFVSYSLYLFYLEYQYQAKFIETLKLLGCSRKLWLKISMQKFLFIISLSGLLGVAVVYILFKHLIGVFRIIKSPIYIRWNTIDTLICFGVLVLCSFAGFIYTNIKFKKIK